MAVVRSFNTPHFKEIAEPLLEEGSVGFDPEEIVSDLFNVLLWDETDNYSLFEYVGNGNYEGHFFFASARGKQALELSKEMLRFLKKADTKINNVHGLVSKENKKTRWIARQLGFKYVGEVETEAGELGFYTLRMDNYE